jgi:Arc/MetJ-type ribon-helix-helix transcriptional regulator
VFWVYKGETMPSKDLEDSRIVSVRLPNTLVQRLDRLLDWQTTHRRRPATRNAALRDALRGWLDQQEQLAGLLDPQVLQQQFQAGVGSLGPSPDGGPIYRLRRLLQWPRERFDAVLEALRAAHSVDLDALTEQTVDAQATQDSYHVHGQCYGHLHWRT